MLVSTTAGSKRYIKIIQETMMVKNGEGDVKITFNDSTPRSSINLQISTQLMTIFHAKVRGARIPLI